MDKIKVGDSEYAPPFTCDADYDNPSDWIRDSNENPVDYEDACIALNELAALREEVERLKYERTVLRANVEASTVRWIDTKVKERDNESETR